MRQGQIRFRLGLLCMLGLLADNAWAQDDLSQMAYTGYVLTVVDGELGGGSGCPFYGSYVIAPLGSGPHGSEPTWSPDGAQIAFTDGADIFVTSPVRRLTSTNNNMNPAWAPDGRQIAFVSSRDGRLEIYSMSPDGSDVVRLTYGVASTVGRPAWSPDSRRIAFNCKVDVDNQDICAINRDGSGFTRLTANPATDADPAWSPDGTKMVFSTTRFDGITPLFALMNPDGSQVAQIGSGIGGSRAAWSPDGTRIAFSRYYSPDLTPDLPKSGIYTIAPNGTSESVLGGGFPIPQGGFACNGNAEVFDGGAADPAWMPRVPVAVIGYQCTQLTCSFDGSHSLGGYATISNYSWNFGDGQTGTGASTTHTYAVAGTYSVRLTVTNANLVSGSRVQSVTVPLLPPPPPPPPNQPPSVAIISPAPGASFAEPATVSVAATASDPDGTISSVQFFNGNTFIGTSTVAPYTIPSAITLARGTYMLTAVATDNAGLSSTSADVTINVLTQPIASFTFACVGLTCTVDGSSSKGDSNSYSWDFGDGSVTNPSTWGGGNHTFSRAGSYVVTLRVTNPVGASTASQNVTVARLRGRR